MEHFVYQRLHILNGKPLRLAEHLDVLARAFEQVYGTPPTDLKNADPDADLETTRLDPAKIAADIATELRAARFPTKGSAIVLVGLNPQGVTITPERPLPDTGLSHSSLRPRGVTYEYSIPFGGIPTSFQLSAAALFDTLATTRSPSSDPAPTSSEGSARSIRREGNHLICCGEAPLFGIRGRTLFTASFLDGATDGVERRRVIAAAPSVRLSVIEEPVPHSELTGFDELFFADAAGITSLSECDGAKFMSLVAQKLALHL